MNTESIFTAWLGVMYPCRETCLPVDYCLRRVWRYQSGNQNPYIEDEQTTQWLKEKLQKDKQRSSNKKNHGCQAGIVTWGFASLLNRKIPHTKKMLKFHQTFSLKITGSDYVIFTSFMSIFISIKFGVRYHKKQFLHLRLKCGLERFLKCLISRFYVLCVCFVDRCLSRCTFWPLCRLLFDLQILITSLWYLQTLLVQTLNLGLWHFITV